MRTVIVKPLGLVTDPNELGVLAPGAAKVCDNLALREAGVIAPRPGQSTVEDALQTSGFQGRRLWSSELSRDAFEYALLLDVSAADYSLRIISEDNSSNPTGAGHDATGYGEPCGVFEARGRVFYAGPTGVVVHEGDFSDSHILGMPQPALIDVTAVISTNAQAIPADSVVNYRATIRRTYEDGYRVRGGASYAYQYQNSFGSVRDFTVRVGWLEGEDVRDGDVVEIWRTRSVALATEPNATHHLSIERVITSADVTARYVSVRDTTPDANVGNGEELYTNPGIEGLAKNNSQMGPCADAAWYAEHAFYAATALTHRVKLRANSMFGYLGNTTTNVPQRIYGIGQHRTNAAITSGSAVITGIPAADMNGLYVGQAIYAPEFPTTARILSFDAGAFTVTSTVNATATNATANVEFIDILSFDRDAATFDLLMNPTYMMVGNWATDTYLTTETSDSPFLITPSLPIKGISGFVQSMDGIDLIIQTVPRAEHIAFDFGGTNPTNWHPDLDAALGLDPSSDDRRTNRLLSSKLGQPEHVAAGEETTVGSGDIIRLISTQDGLMVFTSAGLYRVYGTEWPWSTECIDENLVIPCQQAVDKMGETLFAYAKDRGLLRISRNGITPVTVGKIQKNTLDALILAATDADTGTYEAHVTCDELHNEVQLHIMATVLPEIGE